MRVVVGLSCTMQRNVGPNVGTTTKPHFHINHVSLKYATLATHAFVWNNLATLSACLKHLNRSEDVRCCKSLRSVQLELQQVLSLSTKLQRTWDDERDRSTAAAFTVYFTVLILHQKSLLSRQWKWDCWFRVSDMVQSNICCIYIAEEKQGLCTACATSKFTYFTFYFLLWNDLHSHFWRPAGYNVNVVNGSEIIAETQTALL